MAVVSKIVKWLILAGLFVLVVGVSAYLTLTAIIDSEAVVVIPDLRGKHVVYALERLTDLGLNTKVKGSSYNHDIPKHHVILQNPEPGAEVKSGRDVNLSLSRGPDSIQLPNVIGLSLQQARVIVESNDLKVGNLTYSHHRRIPRQHLIGQYPPAGTQTATQQAVDLLVSLGPRPKGLKVPDLSGVDLDEAARLLDRYGLSVAQVGTRHQPGHRANVVISQSPPQGQRLASGEAVSLVLNRLPPDLERPTAISGGLHLFRYRTPQGFLKHQLRVRLSQGDVTRDLHDALVPPGQEIWLLVAGPRPASLFVYLDNDLVETKVLD
ncbi:MAG: PASTA domain-containing protein [Desulfosarcinaceae bacterium]|nr:PASTA domain-containing protein [Desulfosarcinaceae bacterium]